MNISVSLYYEQLNRQLDIVNTLLDAGADVNALTDEGVSALGAAIIHYYHIADVREKERNEAEQAKPKKTKGKGKLDKIKDGIFDFHVFIFILSMFESK